MLLLGVIVVSEVLCLIEKLLSTSSVFLSITCKLAYEIEPAWYNAPHVVFGCGLVSSLISFYPYVS